MSKQEMRKRLAALSFSEKVKILEKLRDRSLVLAASGLRKASLARKVYCEHGALTKEIRELGRRGRVALVHFPYDPDSHTHKMGVATPSKARICDLNLPIEELPGCIADYDESSHFSEILSTLGKANRRDALHVDSAFKQECVAFVTRDSDILNRRTQLERLLGIRFFDPSEHRELEQFIAALS